MKFKEVNTNVGKLVKENDGYCPCAIERTEDAICPCKHFKEEVKVGDLCICGRFVRIEDDNKEPHFKDFNRVIYEV